MAELALYDVELSNRSQQWAEAAMENMSTTTANTAPKIPHPNAVASTVVIIISCHPHMPGTHWYP